MREQSPRQYRVTIQVRDKAGASTEQEYASVAYDEAHALQQLAAYLRGKVYSIVSVRVLGHSSEVA